LEQSRVALIGLGGVGAEYLSAIRSDERFSLLAVADADAEVLRRHTEGTSLRAYQDYRSLIVESAHRGLDLLFCALEPFQSLDFMELSAQRGISVFHKAPIARSAAEARQLRHWFQEGGCRLVVSRPWQHEPAFARLLDLEASIGRVYAATAQVRTTDGSAGWRGDSVRAGGGVLLNGAYREVDMLTHLLGVPEYVDAQCCTAVAPGKACNYDTEDAAQVMLRFSGKRIAAITASRNATEALRRVTLDGTDGAIHLDHKRLILEPRGEGRIRRHLVRTKCPVAPAVSALGASLLEGTDGTSTGLEEHLVAMAVIEAAYLSARTGSPESPDQFLSESHVSPTRAR
jgi:predicted dehydrogenase